MQQASSGSDESKPPRPPPPQSRSSPQDGMHNKNKMPGNAKHVGRHDMLKKKIGSNSESLSNIIIHCLEVSCTGDQITSTKLTTDRQTLNYYSTIHALELIYFDSNTQETMKKQLYPSNSSNFQPLH